MGKGSFLSEATSFVHGQIGGSTSCNYCEPVAAGFGLGGCSCKQNSKADFKLPGDDLLDMLESGLAREYLDDHCIRPHPSEHWSRCIVKKIEKGYYEMKQDRKSGEGRFLLSAKLNANGTFYISQYQMSKENESGRHIALLVPSGLKSFKLYSTSCEMCDSELSKFHCEEDHIGSREPGEQSPRSSDCPAECRQLLAQISHACLFEQHTGTEMRSLSIEVPTVSREQKRVCWCPRQPKETETSSQVTTSLPEWSDELGCLVQQFNKDRVKKASSKNFICTMDHASDHRSACPPNKARKVLQFGKRAKSEYILDFKHPLAAVQAFAICVSHWSWKG
jgi:hypothetical protein